LKSLSQDTLSKLEELMTYTDKNEATFNLYCEQLEGGNLDFVLPVFFCAFWEGFWNQVFVLLKDSQKDLAEIDLDTSLKIQDWLVDIYRETLKDYKETKTIICFSQWLNKNTLSSSSKLLYTADNHPLTKRKVICFQKIQIDWGNLESLYKARNAYIHRLEEPAMLKGIEAIEKVKKGFHASREICSHLRILFQIDIE
jgi:hypothetical protein